MNLKKKKKNWRKNSKTKKIPPQIFDQDKKNFPLGQKRKLWFCVDVVVAVVDIGVDVAVVVAAVGVDKATFSPQRRRQKQ